MTIQTKYNIGDTVWYISNPYNKATTSVIYGIEVFRYKTQTHNTRIMYLLDSASGVQYEESRLFPSKEELINSL
jgi:hypothetical protein